MFMFVVNLSSFLLAPDRKKIPAPRENYLVPNPTGFLDRRLECPLPQLCKIWPRDTNVFGVARFMFMFVVNLSSYFLAPDRKKYLHQEKTTLFATRLVF